MTDWVIIIAPASGGISDLKPKIESVSIKETTQSSVNVLAKMNFTNPTNYSAYIPYIEMKLSHNGTDVAHILAREMSITPGENSGVEVEGLWDPSKASGDKGITAGRALLSRFISGLPLPLLT